jgi:hypothetical protein
MVRPSDYRTLGRTDEHWEKHRMARGSDTEKTGGVRPPVFATTFAMPSIVLPVLVNTEMKHISCARNSKFKGTA